MDHHNHKKHKEHEQAGHGKEEITRLSHRDHDAAMTNPRMAKEMEADMRRRFWLSFILSIPIFLYSPVGMNILKINLPSPAPVNWLLFILTTPIVFYAGLIFISGAYNSLKSRKLNMSVLIATGVLAAYVFSVLLTFTVGGETFYEAAALLVTFVLFGHWMEMKSRRGTSDALRALFNLVPPQARVIRKGEEVTIASSEITLNDIITIRPGDKIPVDGEVIEGESAVSEAFITGESLPVPKGRGAKIIGGSVNQTGFLKFKATKIGAETVLAQIIKLVETAQNSKAPGQRLADKAAAWLVVLAIGSGLATFIGWYIFGAAPFITALTFAISAVVIACPDALGLATPTAVAVGTGIGAKHNILIKDAATLENTSRLNVIIFDKTGTLTKGKPEVTDIVKITNYKLLITNEKILQIAASVENKSEHPLAEAIVKKAKEDNISLLPADNFKAVPGKGVTADVDNQKVLLGTWKLMEDNKLKVAEVEKRLSELEHQGKTAVILAVNGEIAGMIAVADTIKEKSKQAVARLKEMGLEVCMITGDNERTARAVARELGITNVMAEVLPEDKAKMVKKLQQSQIQPPTRSGGKSKIENFLVAMVGDGINDAPALAQADIGIAIGAGTDVAVETANIVLMKSDPFDIVAAIRLSKATVRKMKQNLFWAAIYNILAIPVAAGVFYGSFGLSLRPEISALMMSASSIIVATNAVMLKRSEKELLK